MGVFNAKEKYTLNSFKGLQRMTIEAIQSCDMDIRKDVLQNIVLSGGNTLVNGFS